MKFIRDGRLPGDGGLVGIDVAGVGPADGDALPQAGPPPDVQVEEAWGALRQAAWPKSG